MTFRPNSEDDFDRFHPPKVPTDRDLMIHYTMALEAIVAAYEYSFSQRGIMSNIAEQAINFEEKL